MAAVDPDRVSITVRQNEAGVWECQPYVWRNETTGKWVRRYIRMPEARTRQDAERMARDAVRALVKDGEPLSSAAAGFLSHLRRTRAAANTVRSYRQSLSLVSRRLGKVRVRNLTAHDIRDFEEWLQDPDGGKLAPTSAANVHWCLSALYQWLMDEGRADMNPVRLVRAPSEGRGRAPHRVVVFTQQEQASIISWAEKALEDPLCRDAERMEAAAVLLALDTGMRVGEICGLRVMDYEPDLDSSEHAIVHICGTVIRAGHGRVRRQDTTKGRRERDVDLSARGRRHVERWLACIGHRGAEGPLISIDGSWTNPDRLSAGFVRYCRKPLKLQKSTSFHTLRHTFATNALKGGFGSLSDISEILGHADKGTTLRFYGASTRDNRKHVADETGRYMGRLESFGGGDR